MTDYTDFQFNQIENTDLGLSLVHLIAEVLTAVLKK